MKNKLPLFLVGIMFLIVLFSSININKMEPFEENINGVIDDNNPIQIKTALGADTTKYYPDPSADGWHDVYNQTGLTAASRVTFDLSASDYYLIKGVE